MNRTEYSRSWRQRHPKKSAEISRRYRLRKKLAQTKERPETGESFTLSVVSAKKGVNVVLQFDGVKLNKVIKLVEKLGL